MILILIVAMGLVLNVIIAMVMLVVVLTTSATRTMGRTVGRTVGRGRWWWSSSARALGTSHSHASYSHHIGSRLHRLPSRQMPTIVHHAGLGFVVLR